MEPSSISTQRLILRQWRAEDLAPFAALNADPQVMEFFPSRLDRAESDACANRIQDHLQAHGWGLWAVEQKCDRRFVGFVGLNTLRPELPFSPGIEVGWRLAKEFWGLGYATEAASQCLRFAFEELNQNEILSFTSVLNERSIAVMKRIDLTNRDSDFDHPSIPEGHPVRRHVLYGISKPEWQSHGDRT